MYMYMYNFTTTDRTVVISNRKEWSGLIQAISHKSYMLNNRDNRQGELAVATPKKRKKEKKKRKWWEALRKTSGHETLFSFKKPMQMQIAYQKKKRVTIPSHAILCNNASIPIIIQSGTWILPPCVMWCDVMWYFDFDAPTPCIYKVKHFHKTEWQRGKKDRTLIWGKNDLIFAKIAIFPHCFEVSLLCMGWSLKWE